MSDGSDTLRRDILKLGAGGLIASYSASRLLDEWRQSGAETTQREPYTIDVARRIQGQNAPVPRAGAVPSLDSMSPILEGELTQDISDAYVLENHTVLSHGDTASISPVFGSGPWAEETTVPTPGSAPYLHEGENSAPSALLALENAILNMDLDGESGLTNSVEDTLNDIPGVDIEFPDGNHVEHDLGLPLETRRADGPVFIYEDGVVDLDPDISSGISGDTHEVDGGELLDSSVSGGEWAAVYRGETLLSKGSKATALRDLLPGTVTGIQRQRDMYVMEYGDDIYVGRLNLSGEQEATGEFSPVPLDGEPHLTGSNELIMYDQGFVGVNQLRTDGGLKQGKSQRIDTDMSEIEQLLSGPHTFLISNDEKVEQYRRTNGKYSRSGSIDAPGRITHLTESSLMTTDGSEVSLYTDPTSMELEFSSENRPVPEITQGTGGMVSARYRDGQPAIITNTGDRRAELRVSAHNDSGNKEYEQVISLGPQETATTKPYEAFASTQ